MIFPNTIQQDYHVEELSLQQVLQLLHQQKRKSNKCKRRVCKVISTRHTFTGNSPKP